MASIEKDAPPASAPLRSDKTEHVCIIAKGVITAIEDERKYIWVQQRGDAKPIYPGMAELPGGHKEEETLEEAVLREIGEEVEGVAPSNIGSVTQITTELAHTQTNEGVTTWCLFDIKLKVKADLRPKGKEVVAGAWVEESVLRNSLGEDSPVAEINGIKVPINPVMCAQLGTYFAEAA